MITIQQHSFMLRHRLRDVTPRALMNMHDAAHDVETNALVDALRAQLAAVDATLTALNALAAERNI